MIREIKFRGKCITTGQWVYGMPAFNRDCTGIDKIEEPMKAGGICRLVDPETVGQYTGLKDRNGKEIYEGDVIEYSYVYNGRICEFTAYVDWSDEILGYCLRNMEGTWKSEAHAYNYEENSRIIGSVYDNPDLLEG